MSKIHRRVLGISDARCHPLPDCPLQAGCARFVNPLPQGFGAVMGNYRKFVVDGTGGSHFCTYHLTATLSDVEVAEQAAKDATKKVRPPIGSVL